jgi:hypothetical protein
LHTPFGRTCATYSCCPCLRSHTCSCCHPLHPLRCHQQVVGPRLLAPSKRRRGTCSCRLCLCFQRNKISSRVLPPRYRRRAAPCSSRYIGISAPPRALHSCCCCRCSLSLTRRRFLYVFSSASPVQMVCRCWYNRNSSSWSPKSMPVCCNT